MAKRGGFGVTSIVAVEVYPRGSISQMVSAVAGKTTGHASRQLPMMTSARDFAGEDMEGKGG